MSGVYIEVTRELAARLRAAARDTRSASVAQPAQQRLRATAALVRGDAGAEGAPSGGGAPSRARVTPKMVVYRVSRMASAAQLSRLGLTSYEAKAYLALLRRDSSTAAQAARLANVPRQRIYDVLASLVDKGLASTRPGQVVKDAARAPELALEGLVSDHSEQFAQLAHD